MNKIKKYIKCQKFEEALKLIESTEKEKCINPELLILKARILQLSDLGEYNLKDIEKIYKKALSKDINHINTLIELGYFYYAIMDNNKLAESYFKKAFSKSKKQMTEIIVGLAKCIEENSKERSLKFLDEIHLRILDNPKLNNLKKDFKC